MATSSFEKEFTITTDEGLSNFIEVLKGNPPPLILPEPSYDPAEMKRNAKLVAECIRRSKS